MKKASIFALVFVLTACLLAACRRTDMNPMDGTAHSSAPTVTTPIPTQTVPETTAPHPTTEHTTPSTNATEDSRHPTDDTAMTGEPDGNMEGRRRPIPRY